MFMSQIQHAHFHISQTYKVSHRCRLESNRLRVKGNNNETDRSSNTEAAHELCGVVACPGKKPQGGTQDPRRATSRAPGVQGADLRRLAEVTTAAWSPRTKVRELQGANTP